MSNEIVIRLISSEQEVFQAHEVEKKAYEPDVAASLSAFHFRREHFPQFFYIAQEVGGRIIGVLNGVRTDHMDLSDTGLKGAQASHPHGRYFCILTVAVEPTYRKRGIATKLMEQIIVQAKDKQLSGIVLMCEEHLIPFYTKLGFIYEKASSSNHGGIAWHELILYL